MNNIKEALDERIVTSIDELGSDLSAEEREVRSKEIESLTKAYSEISKAETEAEKAQTDKKSKIWTFILGLFGAISSVWLTIWGVKKTFEFEKEGTITSCLGRGLINKLLHRDK